MDRTNIIIQAESRGIDEIHGSELRNPPSVYVKSPNNFSSLNSFLGNIEKHRISHLVVDGKNDRPEFLNDIFYNEEKYTFLEKIYDTKDMNLDYHVKIFEINYEEFEKVVNSSDNTYTKLLE